MNSEDYKLNILLQYKKKKENFLISIVFSSTNI